MVDKTFPTWWEAVNWAGETFRAFRIEHKMDAAAVALLLTQGRMAARTIQRAILGLPIVFFFKSIMPTWSLAASTPERLAARPRRPCHRAGPGPRIPAVLPRRPPGRRPTRCYVVLMGVFRSRLLPDDEMTVRPGDFSIRPARVEVPKDFSVFDRWFEYVRAQQGELHAVGLS